jgi:PPP family 3-phenylpropionic acid transporter
MIATSGLVPFAALSASYFAHIGFFNPYLPLWLKDLGFPIVVISLLASVQSFTRVFAPYAWGALSDHTGERVRLLRISAAVALVASAGLWINGGPWWVGLVLLVLFTHTSSMMSLTEAAMAHLVAGDWGRYGRIRLWGSAGFLLTVFLAGAWFERFGMRSFPAWAAVTLALVLLCTFWLPDAREKPDAHALQLKEPVAPILRQPVVRWFFASLLFHVMAHFAIYGFLSLYLDSLGYSKAMIGVLWAVSVALEIAWFFSQGRFIGRLPMARWLVVCGAATVVRMALTGALGASLLALFVAQLLHALTDADRRCSPSSATASAAWSACWPAARSRRASASRRCTASPRCSPWWRRFAQRRWPGSKREPLELVVRQLAKANSIGGFPDCAEAPCPSSSTSISSPTCPARGAPSAWHRSSRPCRTWMATSRPNCTSSRSSSIPRCRPAARTSPST